MGDQRQQCIASHKKNFGSTGAIELTLWENILNSIAHHQLISPWIAKTWLVSLKPFATNILSHTPHQLLRDSSEKKSFKKLVRTRIEDFRKQHYVAMLTNDNLSWLRYFKPEFSSLLCYHPILSTVGHSYAVNKMIVQYRVLSGSARLGSLLCYFSPEQTGLCELCNLDIEDLSHFLFPRCPSLADRAEILLQYKKTVLWSSEFHSWWNANWQRRPPRY